MERRFLSLYCPGLTGESLIRLVEWCDRYSPLAAQDGEDGVVLDLTGCAHLWGGEAGLLADLKERLRRMKLNAQGAIAATWGAAWALARFGAPWLVHGGNLTPVLEPLPVEALRLTAQTLGELRRLGLTTVAAVRKIPRGSLSARFGESLLRRLDQAWQQAAEPLHPWRPPAAYRATRLLAEPIATVASVELVLDELLEEICARLEKNQLGSRQVDLAGYRTDGTVDRCGVRTSKPTRSVRHLRRLFSERLESLWADFGFESFVLSVPEVEPLAPRQLTLSAAGEADDEEAFDTLIDRLGMRLGFAEVNHLRVRESYLPEYSVEFCPVTQSGPAAAEWPAYRLRPLYLVEPPLPIQPVGRSPQQLPGPWAIGRRQHRIVRMEGPERLMAEWWRTPAPSWDLRDYYRWEDENGLRFWVFCDSAQRWFLHGRFA